MLFEFKVCCKFLEETKKINHKFYCLIIHNNKQPTILSLQGEGPRHGQTLAYITLPGVAKQPNLELKTRPKPVLGSLPLAFALPVPA
jgi:hypothetical protein